MPLARSRPTAIRRRSSRRGPRRRARASPDSATSTRHSTRERRRPASTSSSAASRAISPRSRTASRLACLMDDFQADMEQMYPALASSKWRVRHVITNFGLKARPGLVGAMRPHNVVPGVEGLLCGGRHVPGALGRNRPRRALRPHLRRARPGPARRRTGGDMAVLSTQTVADELEIRQLTAAYSDAVTARDYDTFATLWAPGGPWVIPGLADTVRRRGLGGAASRPARGPGVPAPAPPGRPGLGRRRHRAGPLDGRGAGQDHRGPGHPHDRRLPGRARADGGRLEVRNGGTSSSSTAASRTCRARRIPILPSTRRRRRS